MHVKYLYVEVMGLSFSRRGGHSIRSTVGYFNIGSILMTNRNGLTHSSDVGIMYGWK